jgi:hypothetical protein
VRRLDEQYPAQPTYAPYTNKLEVVPSRFFQSSASVLLYPSAFVESFDRIFIEPAGRRLRKGHTMVFEIQSAFSLIPTK